VVAECGGERLEKSDARTDGQFGVIGEDFLRQRHTGGFAAAGQQGFAQFEHARRALMRGFPPLALDQGAAAIGDALQHFAEERGVHGPHPIRLALANAGAWSRQVAKTFWPRSIWLRPKAQQLIWTNPPRFVS